MIKIGVAFKKAIAKSAFLKAVAKIGFYRAIADIKFGDFLIFKFFFDQTNAVDSLSKAQGKALFDEPSAEDSAQKYFVKDRVDSYSAADSAILGIGIVKNDAASFGDDQQYSFGKHVNEVPLAQDDERKDFYKFINEVFSATDDLDGEATAEDDQEMTFVKVRSDLSTLTDVIALSSLKGLIDNAGIYDSGSLRNQGYCSFDYFAEDYVGASRTF